MKTDLRYSVGSLLPHLGLIARPELLTAERRFVGNNQLDGFQPVEANYKLIKAEPHNQGTLGCCEAAGTCRALEMLVYRERSLVVRLPFKKAYFETVRRFYPRRPADQEGLALGDTGRWMIETGVLPEGTILREVPLDCGSICAALERGPLIWGSFVHDGWAEGNMSPAGDIDESFAHGSGAAMAMLAGRGHCTVMLSAGIDNGAQYFGGENSWGWWGFQSLFFQSTWHALRLAMQPPLEIVLPHDGLNRSNLEMLLP